MVGAESCRSRSIPRCLRSGCGGARRVREHDGAGMGSQGPQAAGRSRFQRQRETDGNVGERMRGDVRGMNTSPPTDRATILLAATLLLAGCGRAVQPTAPSPGFEFRYPSEVYDLPYTDAIDFHLKDGTRCVATS